MSWKQPSHRQCAPSCLGLVLRINAWEGLGAAAVEAPSSGSPATQDWSRSGCTQAAAPRCCLGFVLLGWQAPEEGSHFQKQECVREVINCLKIFCQNIFQWTVALESTCESGFFLLKMFMSTSVCKAKITSVECLEFCHWGSRNVNEKLE